MNWCTAKNYISWSYQLIPGQSNRTWADMSSTLVNILQVEVEFENSDVYILSAEYLKICSPAVDSTIRLVGGEKVIFGRRHVGIISAEPIGIMGTYGWETIFAHAQSGRTVTRL